MNQLVPLSLLGVFLSSTIHADVDVSTNIPVSSPTEKSVHEVIVGGDLSVKIESIVGETSYKVDEIPAALDTRDIGVKVGPITGFLPGGFDTTSMGSAVYSIPITLPPGVGGMSPNVSLVYDSNGGNGLMGLGWTISFGDAITRCDANYALHGVEHVVDFSTDDYFCHGSEYLKVTSGQYAGNGSVYHKTIEAFDEVVAEGSAGNGPAGFILNSKQGTKLYYGRHTGIPGDGLMQATGRSEGINWAFSA